VRVGFWIPTHREQLPCRLVRQKDLDTAAIRDAGHEYRWWWSSSSDIARMRNEALERARDARLDFLLMQDDDIYCPEETSPLLRLVETAERESAAIVGAICGLRRIRLDQIAPNCRPLHVGQVYEGERVGTGMMLIDVRAITALAREYEGPWFGRTYHDARQTRADYGEDFFFCEVVRGLGGKLVIDGSIETVHAYTDHHHLHYRPGASSEAG
jgi:hypothetical protein